MSIWAGIKYALNSTLGTPKFKPLNELIESHIGLMESSDKVYYTKAIAGNSGAGADYIDVTQTLEKKIKINCQGTARLYVKWTARGESDIDVNPQFIAVYKVLKNGSLIASTTMASETIGRNYSISTAVVVDKLLTSLDVGDEIEFQVTFQRRYDDYVNGLPFPNDSFRNTINFMIYAEPAIVGTNLVEVI